MRRNKNGQTREPLTIRVLRALYRANGLLTRAQLIRRTGADPATEITRPLRDLRKWHSKWHRTTPNFAAALEVPCVNNAGGMPAYMLTDADRVAAPYILGVAKLEGARRG